MKQPDTTSSDYDSMREYWAMVDAIWGGTPTMRAAGVTYLPKFEKETQDDYDFRLENAKFTNIFRDIVENLASKPFTREVSIEKDTSSDNIDEFCEDVDGKGGHLNTFAGKTFVKGIRNAIDWILVDYTKGVPNNASVATERALGARPFWVSLSAQDVIAAYSVMVEGKEQFHHVRISENKTRIVDGEEVCIERIRVFEREIFYKENGDVESLSPATWKVYEKAEGKREKSSWQVVEEGVLSIGVIPLVPFVTGMRDGMSWKIDPPMRSAADLQIELYQQESGLKYAKENTAFPMLAGNGISPPVDSKGDPKSVPVGPKSVLYAPPTGDGNHGEWVFIEPSSQSLTFLAGDVKETIANLRELGRQPLTAQTGNLTVVTTAFAAQKGNSAIMAWALNLKNALENAFMFTSMWLKEEPLVKVNVYTDFEISMQDDKSIDALLAMRAAGDLSDETLWEQMKRRDILPQDFEADEERDRLFGEVPVEEEDEVIQASSNPEVEEEETPSEGDDAIQRMMNSIAATIGRPANAA